MHILAILVVLALLGLALGIIGGTLFAHRERIGNALAGRSSNADFHVTFVTFGKNQALPKPVRRLPIEPQSALPLAA